MIRLQQDCIKNVGFLSFNLSSRTYFSANTSILSHSKKVIIIRETADDFGIPGIRVSTRDLKSVHAMLQKISPEDKLPKNVVNMSIDYGTFIGLVLTFIVTICLSLFLFFILCLRKYGRKSDEKSVERKKIAKISISEPVDKNPVKSRMSTKSADFSFDFEDYQEENDETVGCEKTLAMMKKEIAAFSTVENLKNVA